MVRWPLRLILFSLMVGTTSALANGLLEPFVGEQFLGKDSFTQSSVGDTGSFSGLYYGGRLGVDIRGVFAGGEYMGSSGNSVSFSAPNTWGSSSASMTMNSNNFGAFLGWEWIRKRLPVRFLFTYFFSSTATLSNSNLSSPSSLTLSGSGYKAEIDLRLMKRLSLNLGYYYLDYNQVKNNTAGTSASASPAAHGQAALVSLSIPIEF